jgi:hypothetical protein
MAILAFWVAAAVAAASVSDGVERGRSVSAAGVDFSFELPLEEPNALDRRSDLNQNRRTLRAKVFWLVELEGRFPWSGWRLSLSCFRAFLS